MKLRRNGGGGFPDTTYQRSTLTVLLARGKRFRWIGCLTCVHLESRWKLKTEARSASKGMCNRCFGYVPGFNFQHVGAYRLSGGTHLSDFNIGSLTSTSAR